MITEQTVRSLFEKLAGNASDDFFQHVADDVSWTVLGTHPLAGHYGSKRAFQEATFARLRPHFDDGLQLFIRQVLVDGDQAAVELFCRAKAKNGVQFDNDYCWICRFRDEQIVEVRAYLDSALVAKLFQNG